MSKQIVIDPITRIEGHSKVTIQLDDDGNVADARFHVTQYRGFEKFIEGRPFYEMPAIMGRICGICTISHGMASAKACDQIMAVRLPRTARSLRRIVNLGSILQSHALSFFYLSSPDFLLGMESDARKRSIFGLVESHPEIAKDGVALRSFGQRVIERIAGKRLHPTWIVPGGVGAPLTEDVRKDILSEIPAMKKLMHRTLDWFKRTMEDYQQEIRVFGNFPSMYLGMVDNKTGELDFYSGHLRMVNERGQAIIPNMKPDAYAEHLGEAVEPWTFTKFPYLKEKGYPDGMYRVGPLARLNVVEAIGTPEADQEWSEFRQLDRQVVQSSFYQHYARLIECLFVIEKIEQLLTEPDILSTRVRAEAAPNREEGIGVTEAPRGTLIHHYKVDEQGRITWGNLIVSTTHNNLALNRSVKQVAHRYVDSANLTEGMLNRVEAVIRTYDPCLSCSTHAQNELALHFQILDARGNVLDEAYRG